MDPAETRMNAEHSVQSIIGATENRHGLTLVEVFVSLNDLTLENVQASTRSFISISPASWQRPAGTPSVEVWHRQGPPRPAGTSMRGCPELQALGVRGSGATRRRAFASAQKRRPPWPRLGHSGRCRRALAGPVQTHRAPQKDLHSESNHLARRCGCHHLVRARLLRPALMT